MAVVAFLLFYLSAAFAVGVLGARSRRRGAGWVALVVASAMPLLLWVLMSARDAAMFHHPVVARHDGSERFAFYVGRDLALFATPIWFAAGWLGLRIGRRGGEDRTR